MTKKKTSGDGNLTVHRIWGAAVSRRDALRTIGLGAATLWLPSCSSALTKACRSLSSDGGASASLPPLRTADGRDFSPIDRSIGDIAPRTYSGDNPDRSHSILWNKDSYLSSRGGVPVPSERVPLVIVGGGMSGTISAYLLRKHQPVILERAERFGGNSRGESWQGIDYSIGAAYFMEQKPGSPIARLYEETGINQLWRVKSTEDPIIYDEKRYDGFWEGATAPRNARQFKKLERYFEDMFHNRKGLIFPDIPITDPSKRSYIESLDQLTFLEHLKQVAGGTLHPHIQAYLEHFCWSTLGASIGEISAAAGLNQYVGEFGEVYVTPGGNAAVAERFLRLIARDNPGSNFRPGSVVLDVRRVADGVIVAYEDHQGVLKSIHAKAVVMSCPKFVAKRVLNEIEPERLAAISKLRYTSYLVANVMIEGKVPDDFYDLFIIGDGRVDLDDVAASANQQKVTDVVLGTYAKVDASRSVLTLYRSLPYDGGRPEIYAPGSYEKFRGEFEVQLWKELLPLLGIAKERVVDTRISRWGHPMPTPIRGLIANGTIDRIRRPYRERVFFVEQDNWLLPCIETAATEALAWAPEVEKALLS